jgi:hypothetical protein
MVRAGVEQNRLGGVERNRRTGVEGSRLAGPGMAAWVGIEEESAPGTGDRIGYLGANPAALEHRPFPLADRRTPNPGNSVHPRRTRSAPENWRV